MKRLNNIATALLILTTLGMVGCFGGDNIPDVSHIKINLDRVDFDEKFLAMKPGDNLKSEIEVLRSRHPALTNIFIDHIMQFRKHRDTTDLYLTDIKGFLDSDLVHGFKSEVDSVYSDRSSIDRQFKQAFKYLQYHFPEQSTPRLYYLMTEFSIGTFIFAESEDQDGLGISLDMFLGKEYPYKELFPAKAEFSDYLTATFDKAYVVKKGMDAIIDDKVGNPNGQRLIDQMIHNGKKQYLLDQLLPATPDSIKWEYSRAQMNWVKENELNLYSHFTSQTMLYSDNQMKYQKFVSPSPNSPGLPEEAPGRTANYIGYKIIQAYMEESGASLQEMIAERETQTILNVSRYKPKL